MKNNEYVLGARICNRQQHPSSRHIIQIVRSRYVCIALEHQHRHQRPESARIRPCSPDANECNNYTGIYTRRACAIYGAQRAVVVAVQIGQGWGFWWTHSQQIGSSAIVLGLDWTQYALYVGYAHKRCNYMVKLKNASNQSARNGNRSQSMQYIYYISIYSTKKNPFITIIHFECVCVCVLSV